MGEQTAIQWADAAHNFWTGCDDAINVDVAAWLMSHPRQGGGFQHWTCK